MGRGKAIRRLKSEQAQDEGGESSIDDMADNQTKISPARAKKESIVAEIASELGSAKGVIFANYQGLTHKQIEDLKKGLKESGAKFSVTKNTLLKLSLEKSEFKGKFPEDIFNDPTATIFISGDPIEALKKLAKASKDFGFPKLKLGIVDGATLDESQLLKLSTLPNKNVLLAQLVGTLNSPIQGLVVVLNGNLQKLVMVLSAISQNKPAEAPASSTPNEIAPEPAVAAEANIPTAQQTEPKVEEQKLENNQQTNDEGGENSNN